MDGDVFSSDSGSLLCKKIIHVVGPRWSNGQEEEEFYLTCCIENSFVELQNLGLHSIAIPPISTGIFGYPLHLAVKTIVKTICDLDKKRALPPQIILIDNKDDSLKLFEQELRSKADSTLTSNRQPIFPPKLPPSRGW